MKAFIQCVRYRERAYRCKWKNMALLLLDDGYSRQKPIFGRGAIQTHPLLAKKRDIFWLIYRTQLISRFLVDLFILLRVARLKKLTCETFYCGGFSVHSSVTTFCQENISIGILLKYWPRVRRVVANTNITFACHNSNTIRFKHFHLKIHASLLSNINLSLYNYLNTQRCTLYKVQQNDDVFCN